MFLGVSQMWVQSYNIYLKSPNLINVLIINNLSFWHDFCYNLVLKENCCKIPH